MKPEARAALVAALHEAANTIADGAEVVSYSQSSHAGGSETMVNVHYRQDVTSTDGAGPVEIAEPGKE